MAVRVSNSLLFALLLLILSHQTFPQTNIQTEQNVHSQFNPPVFEGITVEDGLPENSGNCILQDYLGYIWIGTQNGLAKYDGYSMKVFQHEQDNNNSISNGEIVTIYEDKNKTLWIGTLNGGLNEFDQRNESFKSYRYNPNDTTTINSDQTHCIYEDKSGRFWIGTLEGLNRFDRDNGTFTRYYFTKGDSKSYSTLESDQYNLSINAIIEDPASGDLLIGTEINGLWKFSIKEKIFSKYKFKDENVFEEKIGCIQSFYKARDGKIWIASFHTLSSLDPQKKTIKTYIDFPLPLLGDRQYMKNNYTYISAGVIEDKDGLIWCGFFEGEQGVFCLNPVTENLLQYDLFPGKPKEADYNNLCTVYEDRSGIIWVGTWLSGLMKLDKRKNQFRVLSSDPNYLPNSLSHSLVYTVTFDPKGFIWFCTQGGLDKYDIKTRKYKHYLKDEECITKSFYFGIQDKAGYIWLGTAYCGLIRFDPTNESYQFYFNDPNEYINLVNRPIVYMFKDHVGFLWIGTNEFGLYKYDIINDKLTNYRNDPNDSTSLSQDQVRPIFEDSFNTLWVGTNLGGMDKFDRETEKFSHYGFKGVHAIYEDKQKNFWIGDYYSGLNLYDREKGVIISTYSQKQGLVYNFLLDIIEDHNNNLWIGTEKGLLKFNTQTRTFRNYFKEDGLPYRFTQEGYYGKGPDGTIYFNTSGGEIVFHPDSIKDDPTPPQVVLSGISLFNRPNEKLKHEGFISELKEITLPYHQNDLRFDFVGLHFSAPSKNKYKYFLENFDDDWADAGNQRYATYTNLDPGEYVFRATASNKDGVWNETGISIKIIINPPLWATTWAYLFYALVFISLIYFTWKLQLKRIRVKQEVEMSRFEAKKLHEVDAMKSRFFANISHEFRTPLTLIFGPAKDIIDETKETKTKQAAGIIKRNAGRLLGLVNQLLDLSKLEAGKMTLEAREQNIIPLLKGLVLSFSSLAEKKKITLRFNTIEEDVRVYFDRDKIEKIVNNLLSNAFKFTPECGKIDFTVEKLIKDLVIRISDNGIGISNDHIGKIFDRFYQADGSHTREWEGTGIGLALTKELVEFHKGRIEVESDTGIGTTFIVSIPLGKEHLKPEEVYEPDKEEEKVAKDESHQKREKEISITEDIILDPENKKEKTDIDALLETDKSLLLIVEDNPDVRKYIISHLEEDYRILEAVDGEDGVAQAFNHIADLIISDVMMPKMDGFEMCSKLKTDERTSHIPIIMLTAKATSQDKIAGYETGADDYIMKPFDATELKVRVKNLIETRRKLQEKFRSDVFTIPSELNSIDEQFIKRVLKSVNQHISEEEFSIDELGKEVAMSRRHLHRKLIALTGKSPSLFIRSVKLTKARRLIKENRGTIAEIAYDLGFGSPAYFTKCFKEEFGYPPSELAGK